MELPKCPRCGKTVLLPLSDFGGSEHAGNASVHWKAWACADVRCGYTIRIDMGRVTYDSPRNGGEPFTRK